MRRFDRRRRWLVRATLFTGSVLGLTVFAHIEDTRPRVLPTILFVGAGVAILGLLADTSGADPANWEPAIDRAVLSAGQDAPLAANVRLLENHLTSREVDAHLQARLTRMTDDRLSRVGLSRTDPAATARLGPTLAGVLAGPPRMLRMAEIEECIRRIEELTP
jgi:hypothetical protein